MAIQVQNMLPQFVDRFDAGRKLGKRLGRFSKEHPFLLAIPRGGVEVGYEIAKDLGFPLDVLISRKIGAPNNPEFGVGAVAESYVHIDEETAKRFGMSGDELEALVAKEQIEVERRIKLFRGGRALPNLHGKTAIIVDDGLATGVTAQAAVRSLKKLFPKKIVFAIPIVTHHVLRQLSPMVDEIIFLHSQDTFGSVSSFYKHFNQVSDKTVTKLLSSLQPN